MAAQKIRMEVGGRSERMNLKIRNAQMKKNPYMLVVGEKEDEAEAVAVRLRDETNLGAMPVTQLVERILEELAGTPGAR